MLLFSIFIVLYILLSMWFAVSFDDDEYTLSYLNHLIINGFISLSEPLYCVYRIHDDEVEHEIVAAEAAGTQASSQDILDRPASFNKEICTWTDAETKMLLDTYEQSMIKVGPMKKFKTKNKCGQKLLKLSTKSLAFLKLPCNAKIDIKKY